MTKIQTFFLILFFAAGSFFGTLCFRYVSDKIENSNKNTRALQGCELVAKQCLDDLMESQFQTRKCNYYLEQYQKILEQLDQTK
jgi:sugar phosphate permease